MISFADRPDEFRFKVRGLVEAAGGLVDGYREGAIQIVLPADREARVGLMNDLHAMRGDVVPCSRYWFPACNGEPASVLRWKDDADIGNRCCAYVEHASYRFA